MEPLGYGAGPPLQGFLKRREILWGNLLSGGNLHYYFTYPPSSLMRCMEGGGGRKGRKKKRNAKNIRFLHHSIKPK